MTNPTDPIVAQVDAMARYEALREVVNQLAGLLVARQRAAAPADADRWRDEHRALRAGLQDIEPGTPAVDEALGRWTRRLRQLRADRGR